MKTKALLACLFALVLTLSGVLAFAQSTADQAKDQANSAASQAKDQASDAASQAKDNANQAMTDTEIKSKVQAKLQELATELNLTDDQKTQLKPILQGEFKQLKAIHDDSSMSADQKQAKMTEIHESAKSQISSILTPDQQKKLAAIKENYEQK